MSKMVIFPVFKKLMFLSKCWQSFSLKSQVFRFCGHTVSVAATEHCCYSVKAAMNNIQMS